MLLRVAAVFTQHMNDHVLICVLIVVAGYLYYSFLQLLVLVVDYM